MHKNSIVPISAIIRTIHRPVYPATSDIEVGVRRSMIDVRNMLGACRTDDLLNNASSPVYTVRMKSPTQAQHRRTDIDALTLYVECFSGRRGGMSGEEWLRYRVETWLEATGEVKTPYRVLAQYMNFLNKNPQYTQ